MFVLAAIPRVWAPDLVPFGREQAAFVSAASAHASDAWAQVYADPSWPAFALFEPLLRELPSPVVAWVVLRGLLDALGAALLYLAVRPLVGVLGATLAGALYAASPVAWSAARDPSGSFGPVLGAAALLLAVRLVKRPTLLRGVVLGVILGLLTRSLPLGPLVVALGAVTLASAGASWRVGGAAAFALVMTAGSSLLTSLGLLYNFPLPSDVGDTRSLVFQPLIPVLFVGAAVAALRKANVKTGVLFAMVWMAIGVLGGDWVYRMSARSITSSTFAEELVRAVGHSQLFLAGALLVIALTAVSTRTAHWGGRTISTVLVAVLVAAVGIDMRHDAQAEWSIPPFTIGGGYSAELQGTVHRTTGSLFVSPSLREVTAVADGVREATGRAGTREIVLLGSRIDEHLPQYPLVRRADVLQTRPVGTSLVLPLERETVYLASEVNPAAEESWLPGEAQRPSSSIGVFTPSGADTGARIFTIRPRPLSDWLARVRAVSDGRFADGTALLGVYRVLRADGNLDLTLYWQIPAVAGDRPLAARAQILIDGAPPPRRDQIVPPFRPALGWPTGSAPFPIVRARRDSELLLQVVRLELDQKRAGTPTLRVTLYDERDQPVRTESGLATLALPTGP